MFSRWTGDSGGSRGDDDELAGFLERHVPRTGDQPVPVARAHDGEGLHAARDDDHSVGSEQSEVVAESSAAE